MSKKAIAIAKQADNGNKFILAAMLPVLGGAMIALALSLLS